MARARPAIAATGTPVAFVHGASPAEADPWFARAGLGDVARVSDPTLALYRAFGLGQVSLAMLASPTLWARGTACALQHGFGAQPAVLQRQMPGVFVVHDRAILAAFAHRSPADRPDYVGLIAASSAVTMR